MQPKEIYAFFGLSVDDADDTVKAEILKEAEQIALARELAQQ